MPPYTENVTRIVPMRLVPLPEPFSHPDWLFELKHDGFRGLAIVRGHHCELISRNGHTFATWPQLCEEIAHSVRAHDAVLDGEIVCLDNDARSNFHKLMRRREWPHFLAFDLLQLEGKNLCDRPLVERKRRLKAIMPRIDSRLQYVDAIAERGEEFYAAVCHRDLEGIVAKPKFGVYHTDGVVTNWLKIRNPNYTQIQGRFEAFEGRRHRRRRVGPAQFRLPGVMIR